ncbi:MAG: WD40/YVTN/BNR-like repeat-containing protein, partial [Planctomycetota bacterium]
MTKNLSLVLALTMFAAACAAPPQSAREAAARGAAAVAHAEEESYSGATEAMKWRLLTMQDEFGNYDPGDRAKAKAQRRATVEHLEATDGGGIGNLSWVERGPDNIGGRTRALLIHPTIPSRLYAASVGGGVWRSDNAGTSWYPLDDFMGHLVVSSLAFDPGNPNTIYAGTGEEIRGTSTWSLGGIDGEGIYRSTDAGATWQQLPATATWDSTNRIAIAPTGAYMLAATNSSLQRSVDGGVSWSLVRAGDVFQVLVDPNNSARCVCSYRFGGVHRVAFSTDSGATWTDAAGGLPGNERIEMAFAPSVAGRIYANAGNGQCWRSNDAGANWVLRSTGQAPASFYFYCNSVWVDPTNSSWVTFGGSTIWRSSDGGLTFSRISDGGSNLSTPHSDVHAITSHPSYNGSTNRTVYVSTDGGVYRTDDIRNATTASGWTRRDSNYRTVQYYGVAGHSSGKLAGGTQDNGSHMINMGSMTAVRYANADGANCQIDPTDPNFIWGAKQNSSIHRSTDGGLTSTSMIQGHLETGAAGGGNFIAPLVGSRVTPDFIYTGARSLWRCLNAKAASPSWTAIKPPTPSASPISAIAISPNSSSIVWVGHNNGRLFRTSNALTATPTWTEVDLGNQVPNGFITRILIDRNNATHALVARSGYVTDNLWRTTDNGATFTDVTGAGLTALPSAPLYGIAQHPTLDGRYYVATAVGVFGTSDDCVNWSTSNDGPADAPCYDICFLHGNNTLLVGTHGRGMWTTEIVEPQVVSFGAGCAGSNGVPTLTATAPRIGQDC